MRNLGNWASLKKALESERFGKLGRFKKNLVIIQPNPTPKNNWESNGRKEK
jgi:hypothetical protein